MSSFFIPVYCIHPVLTVRKESVTQLCTISGARTLSENSTTLNALGYGIQPLAGRICGRDGISEGSYDFTEIANAYRENRVMCGITGFWNLSRHLSSEELQAIAQRMSNTLVHRGPDDGGSWVDAEAGIALGHRRLAIVDLSPEGHQPMVSADGRYAIAFNGEIYNFLELRHQLKALGYHFRGHSDTEVMLASFSQWGLDGAIERFNGMFAFALWDRQERVLHLGRDRLGEKPLYYGWIGNTFLFGSELKALKAHPDFRGEIDRDALALFVRYNYIPAPYSIYRGIYKLPPGTVLTWNGKDARPEPVPYWSAKEVAEFGVAEPFAGSEQEAVDQLEALLQVFRKITPFQFPGASY